MRRPDWLLLLLASACVPPPTPPPSPPPIRVPPGCEQSQAGTYVHEVNPSFRYRGEDDGGTLLLAVERPGADGGSPRTSPSDPTISLRRTPAGFVGETHGRAFVGEASAKVCPVDFPTEVLACADGGLLLRTAERAVVLDETCLPPEGQRSTASREHRLLRLGVDGGSEAR